MNNCSIYKFQLNIISLLYIRMPHNYPRYLTPNNKTIYLKSLSNMRTNTIDKLLLILFTRMLVFSHKTFKFSSPTISLLEQVISGIFYNFVCTRHLFAHLLICLRKALLFS